MKYFILIILILSCIQRSLEFIKDANTKNNPLLTLFVLITYIVATIGYFNIMFTTK